MQMTEEQVDQLWRQFEKLHPELVKKKDTHYADADFDQWVKEQEELAEGVLFGEVEVVPFAEPGGVFIEEAPPSDTPQEWVDVTF